MGGIGKIALAILTVLGSGMAGYALGLPGQQHALAGLGAALATFGAFFLVVWED